ncbi:conserved hypothetical protein [Escherichia coli APEC O1]|uniref:Uncharacterized protein n=1 Tax=Escherichia coli O1:K1 / APEC TaxID=405955 RepID=A0A0H2Z4E7_ECOK1|nr:conserved hypothetical protein [Escherichia coli APEC O1]
MKGCPACIAGHSQVWLLPVIGIGPMLTQVVLIQQFVLHRRELWRKLAREQTHIGALFQYHGVMHRIGGIFSPGERAVRMHQYRRDLCRVQPTLFEGFNDHFAGLVFILAVDLFCGHQARAGDGSVKIIGVSSAPGGEIKSGLRPDGGVARVGMHYAANLRKATVKRQMRWRVGRGLFAAFHHLAAGYLNHHHIVGGHYLILNAGRLNHHPLPRFVYRADIAPGERHQMMNGKRQVCRQHVSFQLL